MSASVDVLNGTQMMQLQLIWSCPGHERHQWECNILTPCLTTGSFGRSEEEDGQ